MKKPIAFFLLLMMCNNFFAQDTVMIELRKLFYLATVSESYIDKTEGYMNRHEAQEPFGAYRSMLLFMEAKYAINPYTKLNYFKKGRNKMEETLKLYPNNLENRFLRLAIQTKLPGFLGYSGSKKEDKTYLLKHYKSEKDLNLKARIKLFLKENKIISQEEYDEL
jgi:hypothetical protein